MKKMLKAKDIPYNWKTADWMEVGFLLTMRILSKELSPFRDIQLQFTIKANCYSLFSAGHNEEF